MKAKEGANKKDGKAKKPKKEHKYGGEKFDVALKTPNGQPVTEDESSVSEINTSSSSSDSDSAEVKKAKKAQKIIDMSTYRKLARLRNMTKE